MTITFITLFNNCQTTSRVIAGICTLSLLLACAATESSVRVSSVYQGPHCGDTTAGLRWLTQAELAALRSGGAGQHLNADPPEPAATLTTEDKLLLVSLGQKSSGGYGVALAHQDVNTLMVKDAAITLPLEIHTPSPGSMQTMQLTNPCLVVALRGDGYQKVTTDQNLGSIGVDSPR